MGWRNMSYWLRGGIIGLILSVILIGFHFSCLFVAIGEAGMFCLVFISPFKYIIELIGFDYFLALVNINTFSYSLIFSYCFLGSLIFVLFGVFLGFLFDKRNSLKKRLVVSIVIFLVILPLSVYSHYLKYSDKKIIANKGWYGYDKQWFISDHSICNKLSIFSEYEKEDCLKSELIPEEKMNTWIEFQKDPRMKECQKQKGIDCVSKIAIESNNLNICDVYLAENPRADCISEFAKFLGNVSYCPKPENYDIDYESWLAYIYESCVIEIVRINKEVGLCEKIASDLYKHNECKFIVIKEKNNLESCKELKNYEEYWAKYYDDCVINVAVNLGDAELCKLPEDPQKKEDCYGKVAIKIVNATLCYKVTHEPSRNNCIELIAFKTRDKSICNLLEEPFKSSCLKDVEDIIQGRFKIGDDI